MDLRVALSLAVIATFSISAASGQDINDSPLKAFQDQYNLSPVPFNVSSADLVPGAMIYRSGMNTTIPLVPNAAKLLAVTKEVKNQPKVTIKKEKAKNFFGSYSGLGAGLNINTTSDVEIGDADITCVRIADADAKALIEKDPQVGSEYNSEGGRKNHFMFVASMVCYASDLTLSEKSSKDVLVGVGTVPDKCGAAVSSSDKLTVADLISNPLTKALSSYSGGGGLCKKDNETLVIKSRTPVPVGMSLFGMSGKTPVWKNVVNRCIPADVPNHLCASPWRDIYIK